MADPSQRTPREKRHTWHRLKGTVKAHCFDGSLAMSLCGIGWPDCVKHEAPHLDRCADCVSRGGEAKKASFLPSSDEAKLISAIHHRLTYDAEKGAFYRRDGFRGVLVGSRLGCPDTQGRLQATLIGNRYMTAQLVWLVETGELRREAILHVNGDNSDVRFSNLLVGDWDQVSRGESFIKRAREKFGDLHDYSAVRYADGREKVNIICPVHGSFARSPRSYLKSTKGCPNCCREHAWDRQRVHPEQKAANAKRRAKVHAEYQKRNPDIYTKAAREHYRRNKHRPDFKATRLCRAMVSRVIRKTKQGRAGHTEALLGYTMQEFKQHIEQQFKPWMTWDNHGKWHVDHIRPVSWYVTNGVTDPAVINALPNLQPLEASANQRKSDKLF